MAKRCQKHGPGGSKGCPPFPREKGGHPFEFPIPYLNPVRYDDATGKITRIGDNLVFYGKDGKITQIGRSIVVYSGDKVHTIGNKWVQYISNQSGGL